MTRAEATNFQMAVAKKTCPAVPGLGLEEKET